MPDAAVRRSCSREYFDMVRANAVKVTMLREAVERKKSMVKAVRYTEGSASVRGDALEDAVIELHGLIAEFTSRLAEYVSIQREAMAVVCALDDPLEARVLMKRYVDARAWPEVCDELGYSYAYVMQKHTEALDEAFSFLPGEYRQAAASG